MLAKVFPRKQVQSGYTCFLWFKSTAQSVSFQRRCSHVFKVLIKILVRIRSVFNFGSRELDWGFWESAEGRREGDKV